jgi:hypothetical protein
MGGGTGSRKANSYAGDHDVHVGQQSSDLLNIHGLQFVWQWTECLDAMLTESRFKSPIQGLTQTNTTFARFEGAGNSSQMLGIKVAYVLMQLLLLGLGIYKVNAMGLLPTTRSDWLAWETERQPLERAYFASD